MDFEALFVRQRIKPEPAPFGGVLDLIIARFERYRVGFTTHLPFRFLSDLCSFREEDYK